MPLSASRAFLWSLPAIGVAALTLTLTGTARGQDPAPAYRATVSDLMLSIIQPRHLNLWRARQAGDWEFLAYESGNLRGAFGRVGRAYPTMGEVPLQALIATVTDQPLAALLVAAQARDGAGFDRAFAELTEGCNACHQATNHPAAVIRVASAGAESNLDLRNRP